MDAGQLEPLCNRIPAPETSSPEYALARRYRREVLTQCLAGLSERHRQLIRLRYDRNFTFREIADEFGVVESAALQMHVRIMSKLRDRMAAQRLSLRHFL